jgi:hypothetical protein
MKAWCGFLGVTVLAVGVSAVYAQTPVLGSFEAPYSALQTSVKIGVPPTRISKRTIGFWVAYRGQQSFARGRHAFTRSELSREEWTDSLASIRPVGIAVSVPFASGIDWLWSAGFLIVRSLI